MTDLRRATLGRELDALREQDGWHPFQDFVLGLLHHDGYRDVRHSNVRSDYGRDAVALTPDGKRCVVAVSFDCSRRKVLADARRFLEDPNREAAEVLVFVTADAPTETMWSPWREEVARLGLELRLFHRQSILAVATRDGVWRETCARLQIAEASLFNGIPQLFPEPAGQLRNFLDAYLGTPGHPVPFGGRGSELEALDAWLADASAPPYLLLTAPAGRGKSALLAHWVDALAGAGEPPLDVVYYPVSARYDTNREGTVFASLAARLARLRGEDEALRSSLVHSPGHWRNLVAGYLREPGPGRRVLLVLDALDEAAGWEAGPGLFPPTPPPGLRIVVSARLTAGSPTPGHWLGSLGWDRGGLAWGMELGGLDPAGVGEALRSMGAPLDRVADRVDVVGEIHRLSEGDPLLVGLYATRLWNEGEDAIRLEPAQLESLEPGLQGFFRQWWHDQERLWGKQAKLRRRTVTPVLNLLACALGPLRTEDLLWLARGQPGLDTRSLRDLLRALGRFVVGDGSEAAGYVFAHPRLAKYFWDESSEEGLPRSEQRQVESRFLRYGEHVLAALNEGAMAPGEAPRYVIRHYGDHLARSAELEPAGSGLGAWEALVSEGWWRAWLHLERSYGGFLGDVDRGWGAVRAHNRAAVARGEPARYLGLEVLCALCHARIAAQVGNVPPELVAALVEKGLWTLAQARVQARTVRDPEQRSRTLALLVEHAPEAVKPLITDEALGAARQIGDEWHRLDILVLLVPLLGAGRREEVLDQALLAAKRISNEWVRARILSSLASHLPAERREEAQAAALEAVQWIRHEGWRACARALLTPQRPENAPRAGTLPPQPRESGESGVLAQAPGAARLPRNEQDRMRFLVSLAPHLPDHPPEEVLTQAVQAARLLTSERDRVRFLALLAPHLRDEQREEVLAQALEAAQRIMHGRIRTRVLARLAPQLPSTLLARAIQTAQRVGTEGAEADALASLEQGRPDWDWRLPILLTSWASRVNRLALLDLWTEPFHSSAARLPLTEAYALWSDLLDTVSPSLDGFAYPLATLARLLEGREGAEPVEPLARALRTAAGWWP